MPTVEDFEAQVYTVERIRIRLKYPDGKDVRGDKQGLRAYDVGLAEGNESKVTLGFLEAWAKKHPEGY